MKLCDKLIELRRAKGYSQEQLAGLLNVSRQAVSKWESGQTTPDLPKLVALSDMYQVTLDYLVRENEGAPQDGTPGQRPAATSVVFPIYHARLGFPQYEYKSKASLWGLPLVHIKLGYNGLCIAKGWLAIGNIALGGITVGGFTVGGIALGGLSIGLLTLGGLAAGIVALGGVSLGILAAGGCALGVYALGGVAIGARVAIGASASGSTAIGAAAIGRAVLRINASTTKDQVQAFLQMHNPELPHAIQRFLSLLFPH